PFIFFESVEIAMCGIIKKDEL
ncbi:hypothetical protein EVA_22698, partial [gut metagenome]